MKTVSNTHVLQAACALALIALGLIVWSLVDPRPIPVILAMSVAQGVGTLSFAAFLVIVVRDLRGVQRRQTEGSAEPPR
jgi:peptidoglycan/LPS O-acetylase OafA/YrhL